MKPPTFAPGYVTLFPVLAEIAHAHGYCLAVHGSVSRDMDLIAIPWEKQVAGTLSLVRAIIDCVAGSSVRILSVDEILKRSERKEHGRTAWSIPMDNGAVLDFSVIPEKEESKR